MAMSILNNSATAMALGETNKNTNKLGKALKKVSSGMKINSAGDSAAEYSISEKMRANIRSLEQDVQNVQNGSSMLKIAEGAIDNIVDELRCIKELALNSANDTNTDYDRAIMQKECDNRLADINDIVATTNYNGKLLLDGSFNFKYVVKEEAGAVEESPDLPEVGQITKTAGNYTIKKNGAYVLEAGYSGTITVAAGVTDVELIGPEDKRLGEIQILGSSSGNLNLILKNYKAAYGNSADTSAIEFRGSNNKLILKGHNDLLTNSNTYCKDNGAINIGDGLTIESGDPNNGGALKIEYGWISGAVIGTRDHQSTTGDLNINGGTIIIESSSRWKQSAVIGCGMLGAMGDINISGAVIKLNTVEGAGIGSGMGGTVGNINISNNSNINISTYAGAGIGSGASGGTAATTKAGNINIDNSQITVTSSSGAGIGSGYNDEINSIVGDINITNSKIKVSAKNGAGIGSGEKGTVGNISIDSASFIEASSTGGQPVGLGKNGHIGSISNSATMGTLPEDSDDDDETKEDGPVIDFEKSNALAIQIGTKASQTINCYIKDMSLENIGLNDLSIVPRDTAIQALDKIDEAIEYALGEATRVGAYISRMEYTESNLVTATENVTSAESVIRDSDMAKEMAEYTKYNVLAQAAQAMLVQGNQSASGVLSLLQ